MKKLSKLLSLLMALALCLCMAPPAFAGETADNGSITIKNATKGADYIVYKLFDASFDGDGHVAYTATEDQHYYWTTEHPEIFKFSDKTASGFYNIINDDKNNPADIEALKDLLNPKDGDFAERDAVIKALIPKVIQKVDERLNVQEEEITFSGLEYGYYFITSTVGTAVTVNSTTPDVTVLDKNQKPSFDKTMTPLDPDTATVKDNDGNTLTGVPANNGNIGDTITYTLSATKAPSYDGEQKVTSYYITDILDDGLYYTDGVVTVNVSGTKIDPKSDLNPYGYTLTWYKSNVETSDYKEANAFSILIPWVKEDGSFVYAETVNNTITITYDGTIDTDAVLALPGNKNTADFYVSHEKEPGTPPPPPPPPGGEPSSDEWKKEDHKVTVTYTYALAILKINKDNTPLPGAKFQLFADEDRTQKLYAVDNKDGTYTYAGTTKTADDPVDAAYTDTFVTKTSSGADDKTDGAFVLKGVENGTYYAVEVEAPAGYNLYEDVIIVTADSVIGMTTDTDHYYEHWAVQYDEDGNKASETHWTETTSSSEYAEFDFGEALKVAAVSVLNLQGNLLPSTGGIGTTIFYVVGGVLVVAALVLLITKKRMGNKDD